MLSVRGLTAGYGNIEALHGIDLELGAGEIVALVGGNGAGKTTLLMTICGRPQPWTGEIVFDGQSLVGLPTFQIVRRGIAHVPEGRRIFPRMSVLENLKMGALLSDPKTFDNDLAYVLDLLPHLKPMLGNRGGTLSGGEQQMLAIGRALMGHPKLLLLDEPSLGLAPLTAQLVFSIIAKINKEQGTTVLLIEQNAYQALRLAHRGYVLVNGKITQSGDCATLLADPAIQAAYLG
jgi:branched-chain amino acid transport system ATP-binding protein